MWIKFRKIWLNIQLSELQEQDLSEESVGEKWDQDTGYFAGNIWVSDQV